MSTMILCEKPSVAASIAAVLGADKKRSGYLEGNGYIVSYCFGHLLELAPPDAYGEQYKKWRYEDLPIVPDKWKHTPTKDKAAQLKILKELMNSDGVDYVVNACDAGREGELIFRLVYEYVKCRKKIKRLWISSMEDAAIRDGFANLKDGAEYDNLCAAAKCREQADWAVGISATRLYTVLYGGATLNVGRVQSPTLAMLVKREDEIENFVKTPFYMAELGLGGFTAASGRYDDKAAAESVVADCSTATVTSVKQTEKTVAPPKLYDLTTLQREANKAHSFTAQQTLDYVQSLYEKKYATYPRTDSRYLTDDMAASVTVLVSAIAPAAPCDITQVINAKKVQDHHAIIPTAEAVKGDLSRLPSGERAILDMLMCRLVCAVGEKHRYLETVVTLESGGVEFKTRGKVVLRNGWKDYAAAQNDTANADENYNDGDDEDNGGNGDKSLPEIAEGQTFPVTALLKEGFTKPKPHHNESSILAAMENAGAEDFKEIDGEVERKGLGTSATRAAILEGLVKRGYVERSKKNLLPTDKGKNLIAVLPTALTSAKLTAEWEQKLLNVQRGELAADEFMANIGTFIKAIVLENNKPNPDYLNLFPSANPRESDAKSLGNCPRCGGGVTEWAKGFSCVNNKACGFKLWKESKFFTAKKKPLTAAIVGRLLKDGKVALKDLYSEKTGKTYNATVFFDDEGADKIGQYVNFRMEFDNTNKGARKK
ncbi:DNA topoisomerase [Clostridia bacterium]|nr:DNA topoisomerase [Clostridia bacterium]